MANKAAGRNAADLQREAKAARKRERDEEQKANQKRLLIDDDESNVGEEISTTFTYLDIPVGKSLIGVFVELKPFANKLARPGEPREQLRPVLLVGGESVVLRSHGALVTAFQKIAPGSTVKVACTEHVEVEGSDQGAYRYRVSAEQPGKKDDLPF